MDVPVPAAKQLLQGSSSLLNLSHLLLVFRHWSQAKERDSWDEWVTEDGSRMGGAAGTDLCCSFSCWQPQLGVVRRRSSQSQEGEALRTWEERRKKSYDPRHQLSSFSFTIAPLPRFLARQEMRGGAKGPPFLVILCAPPPRCTITISYLHIPL